MSIQTNIIGFKEFRENSEKYISAITNGRSFTVVRRSKPIFNITPIDEWGDGGTWKNLVDFNKIKKGGIKAEEVLASLKRLRSYE